MTTDEAVIVEFVAAKLQDAPSLTARQLDRLAPLLSGPQTEHQAAA